MEDLLQSRGGLLRTVARCGVPDNLRRRILVEAHLEFRAVPRLESGEGRQWHHLPAVIADVELPDVVQAGAIGRFRPHIYLPGAAELIEVIYKLPAHEGLESSIDIRQDDTLLQSLLLVYIYKLLPRAGSSEERR